MFVDQITKLDVEDQFSFKFLIESVLTDMEQGSLTADSFATILSKKGGYTVNCTSHIHYILSFRTNLYIDPI